MTSVPPPGLGESLAPARDLSEDELAANVLLCLHRLTKGATLYAADNEAAIQHLERTQNAILEYGRKTELNPKIFFTEKSVFVGGRLLKAGRNVYNSALELGTLLRQYGIDEVAVGHDVGLDDLRTFQTAVRKCLQDGGESPAKADYQRIRLRRGQAPGRRDEVIPPDELVIRTYATATIVMRRFLTAVQGGDYRLPIGVRRVAQQLAELSAAESPAFLGTTAVYNSKHEHAGRAVNSALVALAMARQLTEDKRLLSRIAMASLMFDVGIPRVAGTDKDDLRAGEMMPRIIEEQYEELPTSAAAAMWAIGGFGDAAMNNTVLVYEALSVAFKHRAKPAYDGDRDTTLAARIVATSRRFNDLLSNPRRPMTADQALCELLRNADTDVDRTLVRILASALGLFTTGSLVHLSTGEVAKVVRTNENPMLFSMPVVRIVMSSGGAEGVIDLAAEEGDDAIRITALVDLGSAARPAEDDDDNFDDEGDDGDLEYGEIEYEELEDEGDRESWSDLELATDEAGFADSVPPPAPAPNLAPEEDFAPAPVSSPHVRRPSLPRMPASRKPQPMAAVMRHSPKPAPHTPSPRTPAPRTPAPRTPAPRTPSPRTPPPDVDAELMAYLSDMQSEKAVAPSAPAKRVVPPPTPPPRTPAPWGSSPHSPAPMTPSPRTPISLPGRELSDVKPTATGKLAKTPLVHLLVFALDRQLTGTTAVVEPDGSAHLIYFDRGVASKVRTAGTVQPLDKVLRDLGAAPPRTLKRSMLEIEQTGKLHGQHLIEQQHIDENTLLAALQWQLLRKLTHLLSLSGECRYAYYDNVNALADYGGPEFTPVDPLALIMSGLRLMGRSPLVSQALAKLTAQPLKLRSTANVERMRLHADELAVVNAIRESSPTLSDLVADRPGSERTTLLTVYALLITRSLDIGLMQKPPVGASAPNIDERWLKLVPSSDPRASAPPPKTAPFGTLRSGEAAPPSNPPVFDEPKPKRKPLELDGLSDQRPVASPPPASPPPQRNRIAAHNATPPPTAPPDAVVDPYRLFKKAQLKLMTGKLDEAEDLVQQAVDAAPEEPEYIATLAWIQAEILGPPEDVGPGETSDHYQAQIALIDAALDRDNNYAKALFYRAELLRLSGHTARALDDYRRVTELDPHNEEALDRVGELAG